jgi:hypothetical protein
MSPFQPVVLRKIAEHELETCFHNLSPTTRDELATSLVRQWTTYEGKAVIPTPKNHFWFRVSPLEEGGTKVVRETSEASFSDHMRRSRIPEADFPALLHDLTLCQSTRCYNSDGEMLQLRVDPAKKEFYIELVPDEDR